MHINAKQFTKVTSVISEGSARNSRQFWKLWYNKYPETLSQNNLNKLKQGLSQRVDSHWTQHFPEHQNYIDQQLIHHHLNFGDQVYPLPKKLHGEKPGYGIFHFKENK